MKRAIIALSAVVLMLVAGIRCYRWDSEANHGYTWGYWGQFNTISNSLTKLPGITIVKFGCNADVTMEEFGFDVLTGGRQVPVWFDEDDPVRKLSGDALSNALLQKISTELSNTPQGEPGKVLR